MDIWEKVNFVVIMKLRKIFAMYIIIDATGC